MLLSRGMALTVLLLQLAVRVLALPMFLLDFLGLWSGICKRFFPYFLLRFTATYNRQMAGTKRALFRSLPERASPSGTLSLLELGCGTGANFTFYPPGCRVTCVDPNPNFEKFLVKSIAENQHVRFERFVVAAGEDMRPVADGSMDVVVCTLVLCSVENQERILREVRRVLRPVSVRVSTRGGSTVTESGAVTASGTRHPRVKRATTGEDTTDFFFLILK